MGEVMVMGIAPEEEEVAAVLDYWQVWRIKSMYEFIMETEPTYEFSFHLFKCLEMISGSLQIYK